MYTQIGSQNGQERPRPGGSVAETEAHAAFEDACPDLPHPEALGRFFEAHSRSFSFAARWFSAEERRLVTHVYAFCRTTDDLVDQHAAQPAGQVERRLVQWLLLTRQAYNGQPSGISWLDDVMTTSARRKVPFRLVGELISGVRMDLGEVDLPSVEALHLYTYRVASVVGIWLCHLFEAREAETLRRAAAMGRAMQMTNIVRDVGEDLRRGRIYLPAALRERYGVTPGELRDMASGARPITAGYKGLLEDLMERAEADYRYAFRGLAGLPSSFARASAVAAEVYRGIHRAVRRNGYDNLRRRAYTRWPEKAAYAARGLYRLWRVQRRRVHLPTASGRKDAAGTPAPPSGSRTGA